MKQLLLSFLFVPTLILSSPSAFDTSFANPNGYTEYDFGATEINMHAIKVQTDGNIVIAGNAIISGGYNILIARYLPDGSLDTSFGTSSGYTATLIAGSPTDVQTFGLDIEESSGDIVVAGWAAISGVAYGLIARYESDGTLDTTFNTTGYSIDLTYTGGVILNDVVIQSDSNIVATGWIGAQSSNNGMITARYLGTNGALDTAGFGSPNGYVASFYNEPESRSESVGLQLDGSIIISGWLTVDDVIQITAVRYQSDGTLDTSFNSPNGYVSTSISGGCQSRSMVILPNDTIIITGIIQTGSPSPIIVNKFTANGAIDTSFNSPSGYVSTQFVSTNSTEDIAMSIAIQANTKIIIAGAVEYSTTPTQACFVARYNNDGSLDTTFNQIGYIILPISLSDTSILRGVAVQVDQKIVATGYIGTTESLTMRLLGGTVARNITSEITRYGYNSDFISEFLYVNFYAQVITDATAQAAAISDVNTLLEEYATDYSDQQSFNYLNYLYLLEEELADIEANLISEYGDVGISQFFSYLNDRITILSNES